MAIRAFILAKKLKKKKPYESYIPLSKILCPDCNKADVEIFNPQSDNCIVCGQGKYITVKWFN